MTLKHRQPGSSRSEPIASTSIALRKSARLSGLIRTFTHSASMLPPHPKHESEPRLYANGPANVTRNAGSAQSGLSRYAVQGLRGGADDDYGVHERRAIRS